MHSAMDVGVLRQGARSQLSELGNGHQIGRLLVVRPGEQPLVNRMVVEVAEHVLRIRGSVRLLVINDEAVHLDVEDNSKLRGSVATFG